MVCDGAPDVTGLHDMDEYIQAQLLLAVNTFFLTFSSPVLFAFSFFTHGPLLFLQSIYHKIAAIFHLNNTECM